MKLWAIVPELILAGLCLALVPTAGLVRGRARVACAAATAAGLVACIAVTAVMVTWEPVTAFGGAYAVDRLATSFKLVVLVGALVSLAILWPTFRGRVQIAHAPVALTFSTLGAVGLLSSDDLALVVLFLQMMSMGGYVLIAMIRRERSALEATLKYFVYAAVALAVMAYGLTFLYGLTGSLQLEAIGVALRGGDRAWIALALAFALVGYGFEIAMAPVHAWAPDTFAGAPAPVSGFLSVVPKTAALGALLRFLLAAMPQEAASWPAVLAGAAVLSMTLGNLVALRQTRLKRLLAWSSIAHAGYILAAVAVAGRTEGAGVAVAFYLAAYTFMNLGAFAVTAHLERDAGDDRIASARGLARRSPGAAAVMALSMLSLAGIPPLAGFAGKIFVLAAVFEGGMTWLAAVAAANMVVGLGYYARVLAAVVLARPEGRPPLLRRGYAAAYALCFAGTLVLGVLPGLGVRALAPAARLHDLVARRSFAPQEARFDPDRTPALGDRGGLHPGAQHRARAADDQPRDRLHPQRR